MNQTVATANPIFDNVNLMLKQFNGILRYSNGKYQLDVRGQSPSTFVVGEVIEEADIIGSISLKDKGVKKTYNSVSTSIKDPQTKFESRSVSFFNSTYLKQDKSIPKKGNYGCPGITNYFNARFNINQMLDESRYGLTISFKMAPKGILLLPGSIIRLNYDRFGWVNKEFRIASIAAGTDCLVNITADEHNNDAFLIKSLAEPAVGGAIATGSVQNKNRPTSPSSLVSTFNDKSGHIKLTWTNSTEFDATNSHTEIHSSTTNNISTANLLTTISNGLSATVVAKGATGTSDTVYYWVRHTKVYTTSDGLPDRTVASLFHPSGTTGISGAEVPRYPTKWNVRVGSGQLPTSSALAQSRWGDGTGTQPTSPVTGDQAWFNTGTAENPTAQKIWLYGGSGWTEQTAAVAGNLLVDDTVTVAEIDTTDATGGTFGKVVAAIDSASFSTVDTDVLNANSVIAREVQVFPVGGTAPTISGTTLAGAGIDLKQDGDLYVGNAAANKYMFWDQSAGVMTFRGTLNAGDITAGTITADRIAVGSLDADKITANTITADEIAAGAITTATLAADAITAAKIATNAITADAIAAGTITATEISTGAITAAKVAADAIVASNINVANLAAINANIGNITAGTLRNSGTTYIPDANAAPSGSEKGAFLDLTNGKMLFGDADKYIWWDGTDLKLNGVTINASQINTSAGFATQAYVTTAISNLVNGADSALDTLGEIATALGNDAALNTTLTDAIATKLPKSGGAMTGAITTNSTFDGRDVSVDGTKLDAIEAGATADQSNAEIRAAVEAATDSNAFTDADHTKLNAIASGAEVNVQSNWSASSGDAFILNKPSIPSGNAVLDWTSDQGSTNIHSGNYINTQYSVGDGGLTTNDFTNADHTKLNGIAANATATLAPHYTSAIPNATASATGLATSTQITKLDGIAAGATNVTDNDQIDNSAGYITSATTTTTQSAGTDNTSIATTAFVTAAITAIGNGKIDWTADQGSTNIHSGNYINTEYSVGDGGLTTNDFTNADHTKLNGIAANATATLAPHYTSAIPNATASATGLATSTQITKLDGIASSAEVNVQSNWNASSGDAFILNKPSIPSGNAIIDWTASGAGTIHSSNYTNTTYSVGDGGLTTNDFTNTDHTKLNGIATGAEVNVQSNWNASSGDALILNKPTIPSGNAILDWTADQGSTNIHSGNYINTVYTHPNDGQDMGDALTGANVISDVNVNGLGHVTGFSSRALTLSDLSYPGTASVTNGAATLTTGNDVYDFVHDNFTRGYRGQVTTDNSGYTTLCTVNGDNLGSAVRLTISGTANSVVVMSVVDIICNHYLDIMVTSQTSSYTIPWIKIVSNNNEDYAIQIKTMGSNSVVLNCEVHALNNESVTFTSTNPYTGASLEHECKSHGVASSSTGGAAHEFYSNGTKLIAGNDNQSLHDTDALSISGSTISLRKGDNTTETVALPASGVSTINETGNALSVANGTSATVTLSAHANLEALAGATAGGNGSMELELLRANTVIADHITANTIQSTHLEISDASSGTANRIHMDGTNNVIEIWASSVLRVKIGNLA